MSQEAISRGDANEPIRVFVGTDDSQMVATRVLEYSIRKHASRPVEFFPMKDLPVPVPKDQKNRPRTGFSFYRFLIPKLCNYRGRALYLDADMQVFTDLAELWEVPFGEQTVLCTYQTEAPAQWVNSNFFRLGRQFSVMLLDCARLPWDVDEIVRGLDEERYSYSQLMFEFCVVKPHEIADRIPPEWNCLEHYTPGRTKLLHYTVVPTQPWKNDENPLCDVWMKGYVEAVEAGAVSPAEVRTAVEQGYVKPSLLEYLSRAPGYERGRTPAGQVGTPSMKIQKLEEELTAARALLADARRALEAQEQQVQQLEHTLAAMRQSWTWKIGRTMTKPIGLVKRVMRRAG